MPQERLTMRKVREILRLYWDCNLSQRQVATSCSISRSSVGEYVLRAKAAGLSWPLPESMDDAELERLLFRPYRAPTHQRPEPDFAEVHTRLKRKGATLAAEWERYKINNPEGYQYSWFCEHYWQWHGRVDVVMRQEHRAGEKVFSDFAGTTISVVNPSSGEVRRAHLFVATMGASSYTFARAYWSEDTESWCLGHVNAFSYFGGVPEIIVPDNPKAAVTKACMYEPDIHLEFQQMASFFGCAVIPARVRKPRDKAKVEAAVNVATKWIIAVLHDLTFFSLADLNTAIKHLLERLNNRPFKKLPGVTRRTLFEEVDMPALKQLPIDAYEYARMGKARVGIDYHIEVDGHYYSVPFQLSKQKVEYRLTNTTVEILFKGKRIASHARAISAGRHTTIASHMPEKHRQYAEWTPQRIIDWAQKTGESTAELANAIMASRSHPEQGFRSCMGLMRLSKTWGPERLEAACRRALAVNALSFTSVKLILENGQDKLNPDHQKTRQLTVVHTNIRGAGYYSQTPIKEDTDVDSPNAG